MRSGILSNIIVCIFTMLVSSLTRGIGITKCFAKLTKACVYLFVFSSSVQAEIYYIHNDHLGTPQVVTDESQNVVWEGEYGPFGELISETGTLEQPIRFPGQYADPETGYYYNYYRDYDPSLGRYIQSDPIGLAGGMNTYGYVYQNPVKYTDPKGLFAQIPGYVAWCALNPACRAAAQRTAQACLNMAGAAASGIWGAYNESSDDGPDGVPDFDFNDPTKPPVGPDGEEWEWKGKQPQGGDKGGYKNPNGPQSIHPDLDHPGDIGPHWDFNDRNGPGWRIGPDGTAKPKK